MARIDTVAALASVVRGRRLALGWSQGDLARRSGVSRQWVNEFEAGKSTAALGTVLRVITTLGLDLVTSEAAKDPGADQLDEWLRAYRDG